MKKTLFAAAAALCCFGQLGAAEADYPQYTDLPTLYIETVNGQTIPPKTEDYIKATLRLVDENGVTVYENVNIRGRGNSTWNMPKKPYKIKFESKTEFLGPDRAKAKSWTLLANYADKTLMRNALAAEIASFAGQPFAAAAKFVDLVLNGEYRGNYQISDQMEVRKKRVEITEQDEVPAEGADISGGYFLEVDGFAQQEVSYFQTDRGVLVTIKSPDEDIIVPAQTNYIRDYYNQFEAALFSEDFKDPEKGYRRFVDPSTLASWYVATELTGNPDGFWSTYMYKEKGDPALYWGPLWDYDIAFNNSQRKGDISHQLLRDCGFGDNLSKMWVRRMWQDPWFVKLISDKWNDCLERGIEQHLLDYIDSMAAHLDGSQTANFKIWPIDRRAYEELELFSTYGEGVEYLKTFIRNRVQYLTEVFEGERPLEPFVCSTEHYYRIINKGSGSTVDVRDDAVCIAGDDIESHSQQWSIEACGEDHYMLVNRRSGRAISDCASELSGGYERGSQLATAVADPEDHRQHWSITPVLKDTYVLSNRLTGLAWNNSGGGTADGNPVLSWTSDEQNVQKPTRQWVLRLDEPKTSGIDGLDINYSVTYVPALHLLRFNSASELDGTFALHSMTGVRVAAGAIAAEIDLGNLAPGVYVLSWTVAGRNRTVKLTV